jgi:hypothetical protein
LLVWQHHLIDVVTGFLMAWVVAVMVPDRKVEPGPVGWLGDLTHRHQQLALRYGSAAAICAALALPGRAWVAFGWPAIALAVLALAYLTANPRFLQKSSGDLSPAANWMLLPVLAAARFWQRRWLTRVPAWKELTPHVLFGRRLSAAEARGLVSAGCVAVVDLTAESNRQWAFGPRVAYFNAATLDLTPPSPHQLREAVDFIEAHHREGMVYLHCQLGLGRSAYLAAAWLLRAGAVSSTREAVARVMEVEPAVILPRGAAAWLMRMESQPAK